jgi:iron(III) transport system permease protein
MKKHNLSRANLLFLALLLAFFAAFLFYPLGFMFKGAFWPENKFSLEYLGILFGSPLMLTCIFNSSKLALIVTILTTALTLPLAHLFTRYQFRGKAILSALILVPMILPPFVGAIGIRQFFARFGSVNLLLQQLGLLAPNTPIDWLGTGGFWGVVALQVLHLYPIMFLNVSAAMANIDPTLREAGQNLGARGWRLFRTVTLPLVMPGYFAGAIIVFIWAFTDLGTPLIFGFNRVIPVQIFDKYTEAATNPLGYMLVVFVLVLTVILFLVSKRWLGQRSYEMMARGHTTGTDERASKMLTVGIWLFTLIISLTALLPHISVWIMSLADRWFFTVFPTQWTGKHYVEILEYPLTRSSILNSLFFSSLSAGLDLVLGVIIAYLLVRKQLPGKDLLDALAMLPLALPGIVLAFGYVVGFNFPWMSGWLNPRDNPTILLVVSYSVRRLPFIVRAAVAGLQQTSVTLEEASSNLGASAWRTLRKITIPLVTANLIAGTILTFSFAMLEVSDSLILAMKQNFYPITKAIYELLGRINPGSANLACAMGMLGMLLLTVSLFVASKALGKKMGQLFRA